MRIDYWTEDEIEQLKEYYPLYGTKYCQNLLGRTQRSIQQKRRKLNIPINYENVKEIYFKENLEIVVKSSKTLYECLEKIGINNKGSSYNTLNKYISRYKLDTSHFIKRDFSQISKKDLSEILVENSTYTSTSSLKKRLYNEGLKERICEECGQDENWRGKKFSLILDHINGVNNDNRLENLRILCPNCNATLPTHCKGNKRIYEERDNKRKKEEKKKVQDQKTKSEREKNNGFTDNQIKSHLKNRKIERPPYVQLIEEVEETNYSVVGKRYGVSNTAIKKWIKNYEKELNILIPYKKDDGRIYSGKYSKENNRCDCGNTKTPEAKMCVECSKLKKRKVERPPYKQLLKEIEKLGYKEVGKKYNVHRTTIMDWKNKYEKK